MIHVQLQRPIRSATLRFASLTRISTLVLLMLCAGAASPSDAKSYMQWKFPPDASFPVPDSLTYQIVVKGAAGLAHKDDAGEIREGEGTLSTKRLTGGPYEKLEITYSGTEPGGQELGWVSTLESKTLQPWGFRQRFTDERGTETLELTFAEKAITADLTQINGETVTRKLSNAGSFTLLPLLFLAGRGLEFEEGNLFTTMMLDPSTLTFQTPIITVVGKEIVPVPAGIYDCWKVEYRIKGVSEYAWYAVKDTRIVAQYEVGNRVWRLKKHSRGEIKPRPAAKPKPKPKPTKPEVGPPAPKW